MVIGLELIFNVKIILIFKKTYRASLSIENYAVLRLYLNKLVYKCNIKMNHNSC